MIQPAQMIDMLTERLGREDQSLSVVEAVLLRSAFERLDDFLTWLDQHVATDHTVDPAATAVLQMIGGVQNKLHRELRLVDEALSRIEE